MGLGSNFCYKCWECSGLGEAMLFPLFYNGKAYWKPHPCIGIWSQIQPIFWHCRAVGAFFRLEGHQFVAKKKAVGGGKNFRAMPFFSFGNALL